jgi:hypothetical protein
MPNSTTPVQLETTATVQPEMAYGTDSYRTKLQPMLGSPFDERLHRLSATGADR